MGKQGRQPVSSQLRELRQLAHLCRNWSKIVRSVPLGQEQRRQLEVEVEMERSVIGRLELAERLAVSTNEQTANSGPGFWGSLVILITITARRDANG